MSDNGKETITRERIVSDLRKLGLRAGDAVLMHSSLKSIGYVEGGPETVIDGLLDVLGTEGTLIFPSFQKGSEHAQLRNGLIFDVRTTLAGQGLLAETFRKRAGVFRSLNPTHSLAACGKDAGAILAGHEKCSVSVGRGTPFEKLVERNGKILLVGVTHACNTMLHYVENTGGAPTVCGEQFTPEVIDAEGKRIDVPTWPHMPGLRRRYERVDEELLAWGIQQNGPIGNAQSRLISAGNMVRHLHKKLRDNPLYLIEVFTP